MKEGFILSYSETCPPVATEVPNTTVFVTPENLQHNSPLIAITQDFVAINSEQMGNGFRKSFDRYQRQLRHLPNSAVLPFLVTRNMHLPTFQIFDSKSANAFLDNCRQQELDAFIQKSETEKTPSYVPNFSDGIVIPESSLLVSFQYPKPISTFWKKSWLRLNENQRMSPDLWDTLSDVADDIDHPGKKRDIKRFMRTHKPTSRIQTIEWGVFRMPMRHQLLENINRFTHGRGIDITRLNGMNCHNTNAYDHLLEFSFPEAA